MSESKPDLFHTRELLTQSYDDLKEFSFEGFVTKAKVFDVYDGDSVKIVFYYNEQPVKYPLRMSGYDAPEIHPVKTMPLRDLHIKAAECARNYLKKRILNQLVWVKFDQEDKYGRLMGNVFLIDNTSTEVFKGSEFDINQDMIIRGYGCAYDGGHKNGFQEADLHRIINLDS